MLYEGRRWRERRDSDRQMIRGWQWLPPRVIELWCRKQREREIAGEAGIREIKVDVFSVKF